MTTHETRQEVVQNTNWYTVVLQCYYGYKHGDIEALNCLDHYAEVLEEYECCVCGDSPESMKFVHESGTGGSFYCKRCEEELDLAYGDEDWKRQNIMMKEPDNE
mgnify:CR=1 FL=1|tara:strand:+ start:577 stop:888 length:312 start_codon:yes stop_codon:yes gene_type:complete